MLQRNFDGHNRLSHHDHASAAAQGNSVSLCCVGPLPPALPILGFRCHDGISDPGHFAGQPLSDKSKLVAGLLQLFLGGLGIGRFYLGYTSIGVLQIVVTVLTCGVGSLWGLIDAILIISGNVPDVEGRTLRA
jgi:TM2 domain-containing membrane protein YozV